MTNSHHMDIKNLTYIYYHWFWGLTYSSLPVANNLATQLDGLLKDQDSIYRVIENQKRIATFSAIVRFFYWLFNINNVTQEAYLLVALEAYLKSLPDEQEIMEKKDVLALIGVVGVVTYAYASSKFESCYNFCRGLVVSSENLPNPKQKSPPQTKSSAANVQQASRALSNNEKDCIKVTVLMLPHLKVLGIEVGIEQEINIEEFKTAVRKRYLQAHPDKGGSKEEFCEVKKAVDSINQLINSSSDSAYEMDEFWRDYMNSAQSCLREFSQLKSDFIMIKTKELDLNNRIQAYMQSTDAKLDALEKHVFEFTAPQQGVQAETGNSSQAALGMFSNREIKDSDALQDRELGSNETNSPACF